jgi:hypothetical protein
MTGKQTPGRGPRKFGPTAKHAIDAVGAAFDLGERLWRGFLDLMPGVLGFSTLFGIGYLANSATELRLWHLSLLALCISSGSVVTYRYLQLEEASERRGFEWMVASLRAASRERNRQIMYGDVNDPHP